MPLLNSVLQHFELISQGVLVVGLGFLVWVERRKPRQAALPDRWARWQTNIALYVTAAIFMSLAFDPLSMGAIRVGGALGWGGLAAAAWPTWVKLVVGVLVIDLLQYALHVAAHHMPWWWRLHKIHHSDTSMDASTAIRHHPLETLVNSFVLVALFAAMGLPVLAILLYAALQEVHALFCHANLRLTIAMDRWLRRLLITPDMHAVHHSIRMEEGNSNFGMIFPWWDHIFRSYCAQPAQGHAAMRLGIPELAHCPKLHLFALLGLPFWKSRQSQLGLLSQPTRRPSAKQRR